jgi:exonuclease SbcC
MRLKRLQLSNFRSHEELDLDLGAISCAAIVGSNGAGKSSILLGVEWALFGGGGADELVRFGTEQASASLTFTLGDSTWEVNRGRQRGKKSWLVVKENDAVLDLHTIAETGRFLEKLIGFDRDSFRQTAYAPQGQAGALASMSPGDRKALLGGLVGLDGYEGWRQAAALGAREVHGQVAVLDGIEARLVEERDRYRGRLLDAPADHEAAIMGQNLAIVELEASLARAHEREKAAGQVRLRHRLVVAMNELKAAADASKGVEARREELAAFVGAAAGARERLVAQEAALRAFERQAMEGREEVRRVRLEAVQRAQEADSLYGQLQEHSQRETAVRREQTRATRQLEELSEEGAKCPTCQQALAEPGHKEAARDKLAVVHEGFNRELGELGERRSQIEERRGQARQEAVALEEKAAAMPEPGEYPDREELTACSRDVDRLVGAEAQLAALAAPVDVAALRAKWAELRDEAGGLPKEVPAGETPAQAQVRLAGAQGQLRALEGRLEEHLRAERETVRIDQEIAAQTVDRGELVEQAQAQELVAKAFSRDGIPAMLLDNAVGGIESAANEVLGRLGGALSVSLVTQRQNRSGGFSETLEIMVADGGGVERPLSTFSGGEAYRVHVALRLGLGAVLTAGSGVECELLLMDEPTDLDAEGVGTLAELLPRTGRQVLLVTHESELVDSMPQRLIVSREQGSSSAISLN